MSFLFLVFLFTFSLSGHSESLSLGIPTARGTGCPRNTVGAALSPDQSQLSLLFDAYTVEVREKNALERKACAIRIPVKVSKGVRFSILRLDFRGYNSLPKNAQAALAVDYSLGPSHFRPNRSFFRGELDAEYRITDTLSWNELHWTPCGRDVELHVDSSVIVRTNNRGEQALSTLDTADLSSAMKYQISLRKCEREGEPVFPKLPWQTAMFF